MFRDSVGNKLLLTKLFDDDLDGAPFFFSSPTVTMLTEGVAAELTETLKFSELDDQINNLFLKVKSDENDNPIAVGVIPFSEGNPVHFIVPQRIVTTSPIRPNSIEESECLGVCRPSTVWSNPTAQVYMKSVLEAESCCGNCDSSLDKVVLSRTVEVDTETEIDRISLLKRLLKQNPGGYTFSTKLGSGGEDSYLMGSSPELLVSRKGQYVCSNPLAGSRRRSHDEEINLQNSESMIDSEKDLHEHAVVVDAVERALQPWCSNLYVPLIPSVMATKSMLHLSTKIEGTILDVSTSALKLASHLHPTPAVCGYPTDNAHQFINNTEPFDRGYFTGLVGWVDSRGNGEWVVVIRCAQVEKKRLKVYAGAGIVSGSEPLSELNETGNKMRTVLNALGIDLKEEMETA